MVVTLLETGSEAWWQARQQQGIPFIEASGKGKCRVTFWWRDPNGDEQRSPILRVWLNITGVTDHHQRARPVTLARLPGTDAWHCTLELTDTWRGSYCLIPSAATDDFPPDAFSDELPSPQALRAGWRKLFPQAQVDPFNPRQWRGGRGHPVCALEMPRAPLQPVGMRPIRTFSRRFAWNGTAKALPTRAEFGSSPPAMITAEIAPSHCCLMVNSGRKVCRYGPRCSH